MKLPSVFTTLCFLTLIGFILMGVVYINDTLMRTPFLTGLWRLIIAILAFGFLFILPICWGIIGLLERLGTKLHYKKEYGTVIQTDEKEARDTPDGRPKFTITIELDSGVTFQSKSFHFQCDPDTPNEPFRLGERVIVGYWSDTKKS